ncbi:nucleoside-diphosphate sugar epimerase/dehydratase [Kordia algicida OT-1]|uniref:Capsular polysaccharide biosynthesis protein CapD n=1 Tax=Kordia algicida OT-1 TaxID=391587 RepID=A9DSQ5_9FLAO|nr:nucleoside-diphosphate sugar epimerase/dehydratase [Kordia algicida]EDP96967.1 capsular polysaccharide biosynthesis protein CapD [Kordia algicida OT-1]
MKVLNPKSIKEALKQVLKSSKKRIDFKNIGYLPRWLILCFDMFICCVSLLLTSAIVNNINISDLDAHASSSFLGLTPRDALILITNLLFFIFFRTYAGLIRHSTFIDAIKFFLASLATLITLLVVNYSHLIINDEPLFLTPKLFIYFVMSFSFLLLFRVLVKQVFEAYFDYATKEDQVTVMIYGIDSNAIAISNALKVERPMRYKLIGFIDKKGKNQSKEILGLPIIHLKRKLSVILRAYGANAIILADKSITQEERIKIVDECLEHNIKVFRAPIVSDMEDKENVNLAQQIQNVQIEDLLEREPIVLNNKLIAKELYNRRILVTGGAGSIGSEIARQVANYNPEKLIIVDQAETPLYQIQMEIKSNFPELNFEAVIADVRDKEKLENIFELYKPQVVYHAAAYKHVPLMEDNPSQAIFVNVMGTKNVADTALKYQTDKFVLVSTDKAVNPSNVMGASKRIAEIYVQTLQEAFKNDNRYVTNYVTTRFGNVLGSNGSVVPLFKRQIAEGGPLTITHPDIIRYFMTIPEACQLVLEAGAMGNGGEIYIFDMGEAVKIIDLAKKIIKLAGFVPNKDIDIKIIGLRPGEKLYEELLNDKSTTLPTYNEKIMIARAEMYDYKEINDNVGELINSASLFDKVEVVKRMKAIVPEYKSMNSSYEKLDKKGKDTKVKKLSDKKVS